jgi:hypothetical protein
MELYGSAQHGAAGIVVPSSNTARLARAAETSSLHVRSEERQFCHIADVSPEAPGCLERVDTISQSEGIGCFRI